MTDTLEDAIYASPIGTTTPWRCTGCNTPIARSGQPCKCLGFDKLLLKASDHEDLIRHPHQAWRAHTLGCFSIARSPTNPRCWCLTRS